jgi:hypothetical protein
MPEAGRSADETTPPFLPASFRTAAAAFDVMPRNGARGVYRPIYRSRPSTTTSSARRARDVAGVELPTDLATISPTWRRCLRQVTDDSVRTRDGDSDELPTILSGP